MTDVPEPAAAGQATVDQTAAAPAVSATLPSAAEDRPELIVGAAFAGGLTLALLLKRLAR